MQNQVDITYKSLSRRALESHTWMGLFISAFMYLICLSGTVVVFHGEFERWEQPQIEEFNAISNTLIEHAFNQFIEANPEKTEHYHIVFPTSGIPRLVVENDHKSQFVNSDGSLGELEHSHWTQTLIDLHQYLHLPKSVGIVFVSALGALLCAIIISGFFAHPRILKDAFRFRRGGTGLQENIDLHNRLSVWATPFHLMIGITGAYFGFAAVLIVIFSQAFYNGDNQAVVNEIFTPEPHLEQAIHGPNVKAAIDYIHKNDPQGTPIFLTVHDVNTPAQFIEIYVQQPGRLIYSENYRFSSDGEFLDTGHFKDGKLGSQIVYSFYRLHFGDFYGIASKLLYFVLGMILTIVSATGMNIWLGKRKHKDVITYSWPIIVWGTPLAFTICAWLNLFINIQLNIAIWLVLVGLLAHAYWQKDEMKSRVQLKRFLGFAVLIFIVSYAIKYKTASLSLAALQINVPLGIFGLWLIWTSRRKTS